MRNSRIHLSRKTVTSMLLLGMVACSRGDARTEALTAGITKDSALVVMGGGEPHQSLPYLLDGHMIEALLFARPRSTAEEADAAPRTQTPVVLIDGLVRGWGWVFWDSVATANSIPVPEK